MIKVNYLKLMSGNKYSAVKALYMVVTGVGYTSIGIHLELQTLITQQRSELMKEFQI